MASAALPGLVFALYRDGETVVEAMGDMAADTIFRLESLSKPIAAVAALSLVDDGVLALDAPVDPLLPELADRRVLRRLNGPLDDAEPAHRSITVRDLLAATMGMGLILEPGDFPIRNALNARGLGSGAWPTSVRDADAAMAALAELPLMRQPGEAWMYDTSFEVLGVLLARAAGAPLGEVLTTRVLAPLGMADTGFQVRAADAHRLPTYFGPSDADGAAAVIDPGGADSRFARPPLHASAAEGLGSTAQDYLKFAKAMLNRGVYGGGRLLSEASYQEMTRDQLSPAQKAASPFFPGFWDNHGWGLGVAIQYGKDPDDAKGVGWIGGSGTACSWDADSGLVSLLLTQQRLSDPSLPTFRRFWGAVRRLAEGDV